MGNHLFFYKKIKKLPKLLLPKSDESFSTHNHVTRPRCVKKEFFSTTNMEVSVA